MEELQIIQNKIYEVRGQRVMLDFDLAKLYAVETRALKQAVRRNIERFPEDFMFILTQEEANTLLSTGVSQNVIPPGYNIGVAEMFAFTEQGVSMLSSVLRSKTAIAINVSIMRAFVAMRSQLASSSTVAAEVDEIRKRLVLLEQLQYGYHAGPMSRLAPGVQVGTYSEKALVIFTATRGDRFLLKRIGARFNPWLLWQGRSVAGWILPKSQAERLIDILPQEHGWDSLIQHIAHYKKKRT